MECWLFEHAAALLQVPLRVESLFRQTESGLPEVPYYQVRPTYTSKMRRAPFRFGFQ